MYKVLLLLASFLFIQPAVTEAGWMSVVSTSGTTTTTLPPASCADDWYNPNNSCGWQYRNKIIIHESQVPGTTDWTNFPMAIDFTSTDFKTVGNGGKVVQSDGGDIVFTTKHATAPVKLNFEIERYEASTGRVVAWVKIPSVDADANTEIYMYYGNNWSGQNQHDIASTWDSSVYAGVWHLNTNTKIIDSSPWASHGTVAGTIDIVDAKVGKGLDFSTSGWGNIPMSQGLLTLNGASHQFSFSGWGKQDGTGSDAGIFGYGTTKGGVTNHYGTMYAYLTGNISHGGIYGVGTWAHIQHSRTGSTRRLRTNSTSRATTSDSASLGFVAGNIYAIGRGGATGTFYNGVIDEARALAVDRAANWYITEYNNQSAPTSGASNFSEYQTRETAAAARSSFTTCPTGWYDPDAGSSCEWPYRKAFEIQGNYVPGTSGVSDQPVLVKIVSDSDLSSNVYQADGGDIVFATSAGVKIPHEFENSYSSGNVTAWLKVPTLNATTETQIWVYYGNSAATPTGCNGSGNCWDPDNVWDANYLAVYHLNESSPGSGISDSSGNGNDCTAYGTPTSVNIGVAANGVDLDSGDYFSCGTGWMPTSGVYTIEAWVDPDANGVSDDGVIGNGYSGIQLTHHSTQWWEYQNGGGQGFTANQTGLGLQYLAVTYDGGTSSGCRNWYVDGVEITGGNTLTCQSSWTEPTSFMIGRNAPSGNYLIGQIDEIRISNTNRSAAYVYATYTNINNASQFAEVGSQEIWND